MDKNTLLKVVTMHRDADRFLAGVDSFGIKLCETNFYDDYVQTERILLEDIIGEDGYEKLMSHIYGIKDGGEYDEITDDGEFCDKLISEYGKS